mgnify:FL=1
MEKKKGLFAFCMRVVLLLIILFGIDRLVGATILELKNVGLQRNPESMSLKTSYTVEKVTADVVVVGSSKASHHYIPEMLTRHLGMTAYNCGRDGCFFLYQNCIVNMLLDRYKPKMILWDIQPGSFTDRNTAEEYQNFRYLTPYYHSSHWAKSYIDSESKKMPLRMMSEMYGYNSKLPSFIVPFVLHRSSVMKGYIPLESTGYNYPVMKCEKPNATGEVSNEYLKLLDETLKRCHKEGVDIRLFISPVYSVKNTLTQKAERKISRIAAGNHVHCSDFCSSPVFMRDSTLFKDASHLNDKGARVYTEQVLKELVSE